MTLEELSKNLENWRKSKKNKSERVPKELWDAAFELCKHHSPNLVASKTRLNSTDLKTRLGLIQKISKHQKEITFKRIEPTLHSTVIPIFELTTASGMMIKVFQ